jgi:hypothetical protein
MWIAPMLAQARRRPVRPRLEGLDEHRHGGEAVGEHHLAHRPGLAQAALELVTLWKPGSSAARPQPASCAGAAPASSMRQCLPSWRGRTMSRVTVAGLNWVNISVSTFCPAESTVSARMSMPLLTSAKKPVAVAQVVLGLQHHGLAFSPQCAASRPG